MDANARSFFWREPGIHPFHILVTEILLAKTKAELAAPIALQVLARYSTPLALSLAKRRDLERLLFPLGLYRKRARHLIACATVIVERHAGEVPQQVAELMQLPYVGRYAAHAIACVAFDQAVPVIDANVSRIYLRVFSLPQPPERLAAAHDLWSFAARVLPRTDAKKFNWAVLDLGGTVCTAKAPRCTECPIAICCDTGKQIASPLRAPSRARHRRT
ncbi:MAG: A/G-specific adenine glycosylase [Gemmatimonadaceae bacterium]|nr:A/G-specific adenine glycosylase [Gemmatimonadaceae bacterium]